MSADQEPTTAAVRRLAEGDAADLPVPGRGRTAERHRRLAEIARAEDVSVARLVEAHVDAHAILDEAGRAPVGDALYGVWASDAGGHGLRMDRRAGTVSGTKRFCSGLGVVDRALVTVVDDEGHELLVDVGVGTQDAVSFDLAGWRTEALRRTCTGDVAFDAASLGDGGVVHEDHRWYLDRPGFWHGACGPASCWAGAALGLVDAAERLTADDPHVRAHLGALRAGAFGMGAVLAEAGRAIDADPADVEAARRRALSVRHLVEQACREVVDRFGRAFGPRPLVGDAAVVQRIADVSLYIRQHHAERDLDALGGIARDEER